MLYGSRNGYADDSKRRVIRFFIVSQNTEKKSDSENLQKGERTKR